MPEPWQGLAALTPDGGSIANCAEGGTERGAPQRPLSADVSPTVGLRDGADETARPPTTWWAYTPTAPGGRRAERQSAAADVGSGARSRTATSTARQASRPDRRPPTRTVAWNDCFDHAAIRLVPSKVFLPYVARMALVVLTGEFHIIAQFAVGSAGYDCGTGLTASKKSCK